VGAIYAVSMVVKIVGRLAPGWGWLAYTTFFTAFEPQALVGNANRTWSLWTELGANSWQLGGLGYDSVLVGLGLLAYVVASVVFQRRDLPAPL
jgi:ABC-2 type transport system permease protein